KHDDAPGAPLAAVVGELEAVYAAQLQAPGRVAGRSDRRALDGLIEELQPLARARVLPRGDGALPRAHAVEPQPGDRGEDEQRDGAPLHEGGRASIPVAG